MKIACYLRNPAVYTQVKEALMRAGLEPVHFTTETDLLRALRRRGFSLIIIDITVAPGSDDNIFSWLNYRSGDRTPTLVLSPTRSAELAALTLDSGADDFLVRPFEVIEFTARVNALIRRSAPTASRRTIEYAGFSLNRESTRFSYQGTPINLTPREFSMAWLFFSSPGVYISRDTIGAVIWSTDSDIAGRTIEQHVYKLRKKLQIDPNRPVVMIRTAYNQGYRLELCKDASPTSDTADPNDYLPA
ncbi:histidine kinase [Herbaspirillum rubrisubalbicans]|uniref:Histidine kinase n=2 Tax=Oxalobacteraceae TaxID=75682 RepID=A0ABX9C7Z3_9BURK|nr:histidine kinase [Herbaspirillum rubrisubalbicans]RAM67058.1 histidine kinase [Herbaspirillum rubrisubalbicans]